MKRLCEHFKKDRKPISNITRRGGFSLFQSFSCNFLQFLKMVKSQLKDMCSVKLYNHLGWKRFLRSNPTINPELPSPPMNHVLKNHINVSFKLLQGWWLHYISGQPVLPLLCLDYRKLNLIIWLDLTEKITYKAVCTWAKIGVWTKLNCKD